MAPRPAGRLRRTIFDGRPSVSRYSNPSVSLRIPSGRSRKGGSRYRSHKSGGSRTCPSASIAPAWDRRCSTSGVLAPCPERRNRDARRAGFGYMGARVESAARVNRHAGDGTSGPSVPEPPFAEQVRTLLHLARTGTLATQSRRVPGFPFGSVAPFGLDAARRPPFLVSTL